MVTRLIDRLGGSAQRGSKPRCHLLTHGSPEAVAARLTALAAPFAVVSPGDRWMPRGFEDLAEPQLDKAPQLLGDADRAQLAAWWLPPDRSDATTPNFDIASKCSVGGRPGLLLVEAKAHDVELRKEAEGKRKEKKSTTKAQETHDLSHESIGRALTIAGESLSAATGQSWALSRDHHYQLSNRLGWAWKLTELGLPVVLVYLGFLHADEMKDRGSPFRGAADWEHLAQEESKTVCPPDAWNRAWHVNGVTLALKIAALEQPLA